MERLESTKGRALPLASVPTKVRTLSATSAPIRALPTASVKQEHSKTTSHPLSNCLAKSEPTFNSCHAQTKTGARCKNRLRLIGPNLKANNLFCHLHQPQPEPQTLLGGQTVAPEGFEFNLPGEIAALITLAAPDPKTFCALLATNTMFRGLSKKDQMAKIDSFFVVGCTIMVHGLFLDKTSIPKNQGAALWGNFRHYEGIYDRECLEEFFSQGSTEMDRVQKVTVFKTYQGKLHGDRIFYAPCPFSVTVSPGCHIEFLTGTGHNNRYYYTPTDWEPIHLNHIPGLFYMSSIDTSRNGQLCGEKREYAFRERYEMWRSETFDRGVTVGPIYAMMDHHAKSDSFPLQIVVSIKTPPTNTTYYIHKKNMDTFPVGQILPTFINHPQDSRFVIAFCRVWGKGQVKSKQRYSLRSGQRGKLLWTMDKFGHKTLADPKSPRGKKSRVTKEELSGGKIKNQRSPTKK